MRRLEFLTTAAALAATTCSPGGFGNQVKSALGLAVFEAVRDVYGIELRHYFKYVSEGDESTEPRLEHVRDLDTDAPRVVVTAIDTRFGSETVWTLTF